VTVSPDEGAAKHLAEAIRQLRVQHAPKTALATLARHETELGKHGLVHEVLLVRVEALLLLDRKEEVLHLLDRAYLADVAAQKSLLLTRGELRAAAGRCTEALGDFDRVLALPPFCNCRCRMTAKVTRLRKSREPRVASRQCPCKD
jgi:hypothetical protein